MSYENRNESTTPVSPDMKIRVLLTEYEGLRKEVLVRTGHGFQITFVTAIGAIWFIATLLQSADLKTWLMLLAFVFVVAISSWFTMRDIGKAALRIRQIERDVNNRAGEELLVWENKWGGEVTGYWGAATPLTNELSKTELQRVEARQRGGMSLWGNFALIAGIVFGFLSGAYYLLLFYEQLKNIWPFSQFGFVTPSFAAEALSSAPIQTNLGLKVILLGVFVLFMLAIFAVSAVVVLQPTSSKANQEHAWNSIKFLSGFFVGVSTTILNAL